jgi:hypothetical protein
MRIYILLLESNKYYIIQNNNFYTFDEIIKLYTKNKDTLPWLKKYKPIKIIESIISIHENYFHNITLHYMQKYGIDNVSNTNYFDIVLPIATRSSFEKEIQNFTYIDKYKSYNYYPLFVQTVQNNLSHFLNQDTYKSATSQINIIENELNRLYNRIKKIKQLQNNINKTNGFTYSEDDQKKYIDLISFSRNNDLMNAVYLYDDKNTIHSNDIQTYRNMIRELEDIGLHYNLIFNKKISILLLNIIGINNITKNELIEFTKAEPNLSNIDIIEYTILALTEEKIKLMIDNIEPPPYSN